ncbi:helix-turn-helix domain-containing protein [Megamonas hypermegale]|uniref:helix-turn-helix domain-containing protein n=1 Tax=Megamonas hypermegale TaxID=158847 RepID=UPI00255CDFC4|nr:helix-turn-helix transcriptional regulator [Megamonas hypermegale]
MEQNNSKIYSLNDYLNETLSTDKKKVDEKKVLELRYSFLENLHKLRKEKKLTQKDLEKITGIKQSTIAKIEHGVINPSMNNIFKLVIAMGKTIKITD